MTALTPLPLIVLLPVCFFGGLFIGYGYFRALRATADLIVGAGDPLRVMALTLGRFSILGTGFYLAVLLGGPALLAVFAGVLCAKWIMLRAARKTST